MIKQNIKMRVTPEQSKAVQEICFKNNIIWKGKLANNLNFLERPYLFILKHLETGNSSYDFKSDELEEIDADLFIRINGNCEKESTLNDDDIARILKASEDQPKEYLRQKIINLHDQLNKYRKTVQNQKEDLQNQLNMANRTVKELIDNGIDLVKYIEEKDAIIKYLESKLEI